MLYGNDDQLAHAPVLVVRSGFQNLPGRASKLDQHVLIYVVQQDVTVGQPRAVLNPAAIVGNRIRFLQIVVEEDQLLRKTIAEDPADRSFFQAVRPGQPFHDYRGMLFGRRQAAVNADELALVEEKTEDEPFIFRVLNVGAVQMGGLKAGVIVNIPVFLAAPGCSLLA